MTVVSVSIPPDLLERVDQTISQGNYRGRSEVARVALQAHVQASESRRLRTGHVHGSITVTYPHGEEPRVSEVRHAFHDVVLSLMHTHCEAEVCMDVLIVGGDITRVQGAADALARLRTVRQATLVLAD